MKTVRRTLAMLPRTATTVLAVLLVSGTLSLAQEPNTRPRSVYEDLQLFSQVLNQIRVNHPDSIDTHTLLMAAIEGMVRAADPHSYVLPAARLSPQRQEAAFKGELYPVPIAFEYVAEAPFVVSVYPGSKAAELDIRPGDELVAIDGEPVTAESGAELELVLAGKKNSRVALTLRRRRWDGSEATLEREVKRERVDELTAIGTSLMLDERTGYVRLMHFSNEKVADDTKDALRNLEKRGMIRLVLDLRDNSGGIVSEAAKVAGEFLPRGAVVYTTEGRKKDVADTVYAQRSSRNRTSALPIVVLVNIGTASAAELVAGALQDHDRGWIVGRPTFGKSLLMQGFPMTDGSLIVLVIGHLKTPCGRVIQRQYRNVRRREYVRRAGFAGDSTERPACLTSGGRRVYGGGGIYPDVVLALPRDVPIWLTMLQERQLPLRWVGTYLTGNPALPASPAEFAHAPLPDGLVRAFLDFARAEGADMPDDAAQHPQLRELLVESIAYGRWGFQGYFTIAALRDAEVESAMGALGEAEQLLAGQQR